MKEVGLGLLFSLTGATSATEKGQFQAARFALHRYLQKRGDKMGFNVKILVGDIRSDPDECARKAEEMVRSGVRIFVGCYTSSCRKALLPVLERYDALLLYPTLYEGVEAHPHVFYTGEVPNQQVLTLLHYMTAHYGKNVYLIGTDYIYPHFTNRQVYEYLNHLGGKVVGENYVSFGQARFDEIIQEILDKKPDAVFSTLVGENVKHFYRGYHQMGVDPAEIPIFSPITSELEIQAMGARYGEGHYGCGSYFQSISNEENRKFVTQFQRFAGRGSVIASVMMNTYIGVSLLLEALEKAESLSRHEIFPYLKGKVFRTPGGEMRVDPHNMHLSRPIFIGRVNGQGQFDVVWSSPSPIEADPFFKYDGASPRPVVASRKEKIYRFGHIRTKSKAYQQTLKLAEMAAATDSNVLILGETGTGKEVLARSIHERSKRKDKPFVAVNLGAIPKELIGSELFGYVEGAFTGAKKGGLKGKFEQADGGTLFLDEIGEMPLELQPYLLRAIATKTITRLGDERERKVDVRLISATNQNLLEAITYGGSFRADLYYRLNVFTLNIPPLRERKEDIPHLVEELLEDLYDQYQQGPIRIAREAIRLLERHAWPGNIRELKNTVERAFFLAFREKEIQKEHIHLDGGLRESSSPLETRRVAKLKEMEKETIMMALAKSSTIKEVAAQLGISRSTLYRKMKEFNLRD